MKGKGWVIYYPEVTPSKAKGVTSSSPLGISMFLFGRLE
jgi:hypothetical protein